MLAATLALQLFSVGLTAIQPGTNAPELLRADRCRSCHVAEHADWRASRHAQAWTNAIFQREYRQHPQPWCVHCHAPLTQQAVEIASGYASHADALANEGVGCASCHVRDGVILAARKRAHSPHATRVVADFDEPAFCAGCHQFGFPRFEDNVVVGYTAHPMQDTVAQHERGPDAAVPCLTCHAAIAVAPGRHKFPGAHDSALLERALAVEVCRDRDKLRIAVTNRGAGHRVPTGDVHRHLVLRAWRPSAPERLVEEVFGRRFAPAADGGKVTVADSTLAPRERRVVSWPLARISGSDGAGGDDTIAVELRYVFVIDEQPLTPLAEPSSTVVFRSSGEPAQCAD